MAHEGKSPAGVIVPGFGPPLDYRAGRNPLSGGKDGGNPEVAMQYKPSSNLERLTGAWTEFLSAEAKAILMETAQNLERYYTTNNTYDGATVSSTVSPKGASGSAVRYRISWSIAPTATAYTVQAVPANAQAGDSCGTLTLTQTGARSPTTAGCW